MKSIELEFGSIFRLALLYAKVGIGKLLIVVFFSARPWPFILGQGLDFDANQRIDSRRDSRHIIAARIKVDSRERYHD